jgi:ribokinase
MTSATTPPRILVVGSINMDMACRTPHLPAPGETVLGNEFHATPGGKGANQAVAVARLGGHVTMIGCVGDDDSGHAIRAALEAENIDIQNVAITEQAATGVAVILVDAQGENAIVVASGANERVTPDDIFGAEDCFAKADVVLVQLELPCPTVRAALDLARRHGCLTVLDPAPAKANLHDSLCEVDILSPNVSEAEILTGKKGGEDRIDKLVAADLIARGAKAAVLKLGPRGCLVVCDDGHMYRLATHKVDVVDTTAAGDAFTAALTLAVARGEPIDKAARYANAAGALATTRFGAQQAMPTDLEVQILLRDQPAL